MTTNFNTVWPVLLAVTAGVGVIVLTILLARRKSRSGWLWGVAATLSGVIPALVALAFFGDLAKMTSEQSKKSILKERILCGVLITLGVLHFISQLLRSTS